MRSRRLPGASPSMQGVRGLANGAVLTLESLFFRRVHCMASVLLEGSAMEDTMLESRTTRVLVVDAEPAARSGLQKLLSERFTVDVAEDGLAALAAAADHAPPVLVTHLKI